MIWCSLLLRMRKKRNPKSSRSFLRECLVENDPYTSFHWKRRTRRARLDCQYGRGKVATTRTRMVLPSAISRLIIKCSSKMERLSYYKGVSGFSSMRKWWNLL
jgi:hypothetical protein